MAAVAICGWVAGRIVGADMAVRAGVDHRPKRGRSRGAGREHMGSLQGKPSRGVIKFSIRPDNRVMTSRTERGSEARRDVVWHIPAEGGRTVPGRLVATVAIRVRGRESIV